uniref:Lipocalin/cytosolic fatty-acid binding domain-containing protein n=2 Tax=Otolemur garnettii TaxID=30611 RepID=H0XMX4_OTOGA
MKLLFLSLSLALVCAQEEGNNDVVTSNFNLRKISGGWYSILLASDHKEKIKENGSMRIFVEQIQALKNSSLYFKYHTLENGECSEISFVCDQTEKDGECAVEYDGHNIAVILETNYTDYLIYFTKNYKNGETTHVMELYGRKPDVSLKLKKKFLEYCKKHGIAKKNIIDLTKVDRCLQYQDGAQAQDPGWC